MDEYKADREILPCPICGNAKLTLHDNSKTASGWWIRCTKEDDTGYHQLVLHYGTRQEAIEKWNNLPRTNFGG
jgi:hypothetical protein